MERDLAAFGASFETVLAEFASKRILVIGDLMLDRFSYGSVGRISPEAPAAVINLDRIEESVGGAGNVACNIATLGGRCCLLGMVGADEAAQAIARRLGHHPGIEPHLVQTDDRATTVKNRFVAKLHNTHLLRADVEDASPIKPAMEDQVLRAAFDLIPQIDAVLLSDYSKGLLTDRVVQEIIAAARKGGKIVIVDPKGRHYARYRGAHFITPNMGELGHALGASVDGEAAQQAAARQLIDLIGADAILVTRGEHGVLVVPADGEVASFPTTARRVVDVSGAGDTLVAGFALALVTGASIANAARLANYAAGIVVAKPGTASVTHHELADVLLSRPDFQTQSKIFAAQAALRQTVSQWREEGLVIGFTNGCFDIIHEGHIELLTEARSHCDRLIVAINSDASVKKLKGPTRPIQSERARAKVLSAMAFVDAVITFDAETPIDLISALLPNVLIKGADYQIDQVVGRSIVEANGGRVILVQLVPDTSTTNIVEKMRAPESDALVG
jgi:D-beta-D-heptose 7-phosphate kinase / D-beta-D-heptose 1-phosphate adenosyltransferase